MSVDDETEERILAKAAYIEEAIEILAEKQSLGEAAYLAEREQRDIVEREFQTAIEACIDIASFSAKPSVPKIPNGTRRSSPYFSKRMSSPKRQLPT